MTSPAHGGPDTAEWWAQLFHATQDAVDGVPYAAGSEYPVPHIAAFRAAAEPLLLPAVQRLAVEKAAEVVEALRPHIPPSTDPNRRTAVIVRSTLNQAARAVRALALAAAAQPGDGRTGA